jgi:hypothetical protein
MSRVPPVREGIGASAEGKPDIFWVDVAVSLGEGINEDVQTAAKAIDDCADLRVDDQRQRLLFFDPPTLVASLRIFIGERDIWAALAPGFNSSIENLELVYGPFDCGLGGEEIVTHGTP